MDKKKRNVYLRDYQSPLGPMLLAADEEGLTGLWFEGQKYYMAGIEGASAFYGDVFYGDVFYGDVFYGDRPCLQQAVDWLDAYFAGQEHQLPPLHLCGTDFQKAVWAKLLDIPRGKTSTYGAIAAAIAAERGLPSMSAQAVGQAVGHNPVSVIVPCHRVLGAKGQMTGYAAGLERKKALLELESML